MQFQTAQADARSGHVTYKGHKAKKVVRKKSMPDRRNKAQWKVWWFTKTVSREKKSGQLPKNEWPQQSELCWLTAS